MDFNSIICAYNIGIERMGIIMKNLILLMFLILVTGLATGCGQTKLEDEFLDEVGLCFEFDLKCGEEHNDQFDAIEDRLNKLEALAHLNRNLININSNNMSQGFADLNIIVQDLQSQISSLSSQQTINTADILALQNAISDLEDAQEQGVAEVIDPCGDMAGHFDEVILRLHDGTYIAYFQDGGRRFLGVLSDGSYRTTDRQQCRFSIVNGLLQD